MKRNLFYIVVLVVLGAGSAIGYASRGGAGAGAEAGHAAHFHVAVTPGSVRWEPFYEGAEIAVLAGDPKADGSPYVIRIRHRDGLRVPPHWHPFDENLTVVKGTWVMGMGEHFDLAAAQEFPEGSYLVSPKNVPHFALSKGETIVQIHGTGPFAAYFVRPEDDVFRKAK